MSMDKRWFFMVVASSLAACAKPIGPTRLVRLAVGVQSTRPDETHAAWQPLVADLGRKLRVPAQVLAASQTEVVRALAEGRVDVAWLSSSAAIDAVADANARTFALYHHVNGTTGYRAVLLARADAGIRTLEEALAPGRYRYAAGAKTSTSGYVLPQHFLFAPRATTPEARFKSVVYGGHPANLESLWAGQVDVAINNSTDLAAFVARNPAAKDALVTLWESPLVPNDVLMVRADELPVVRLQLAELFLSYGKTPAEKELLRGAAAISHFAAANDRVLDPVSGFKFATERAQIQQAPALSAEERAKRLAVLEQRAQRFRSAVAGIL